MNPTDKSRKTDRNRLKKAYTRDRRPSQRATASRAHARQLEITQAKERIISGIHTRRRQKCITFLSDPNTISVKFKLATDINQLPRHVTLDVNDADSVSKAMKIVKHRIGPPLWTISSARTMPGGDPQQQPPETVGPATSGTRSPCSGTPDADDLASVTQMSEVLRQERADRLKRARDSKPKTAPRRTRPVQRHLPKVTYRAPRSASAQSGAHLEPNLGPYAAAGMKQARENAARRPRARIRSPSPQPEQYEDQQCEYEDAVAPLKQSASLFEDTVDDLLNWSVFDGSVPPSVRSPRASSLAWGNGKQARSYHSRSSGAGHEEHTPLISAKVTETFGSHSMQQQMHIHLQNTVKRCNRLASARRHASFSITPETSGDFEITINAPGDADTLDGIYNCADDLRTSAKPYMHRGKETEALTINTCADLMLSCLFDLFRELIAHAEHNPNTPCCRIVKLTDHQLSLATTMFTNNVVEWTKLDHLQGRCTFSSDGILYSFGDPDSVRLTNQTLIKQFGNDPPLSNKTSHMVRLMGAPMDDDKTGRDNNAAPHDHDASSTNNVNPALLSHRA